jgi:hypothetical protein
MRSVTNVLFVLFLLVGAGLVYAGKGVCQSPKTETSTYQSYDYYPSGRPRWTLLTGLVLKAYWKMTDRGIIELLEVSPPLVHALSLKKIPNYSTLTCFASRIDLDTCLPQVFADLAEHGVEEKGHDTVAVDSTGMESTAASVHFQRRKGGRPNIM